jgi:putative transposase
MDLRKQGHCAYRCEYHLVIVSKYRRKIFNDGSFRYFKEIMKRARDDIPEVSILEMNHDKDHIHLLLSIPPKMRVSDVVRYIKSQSGRLMKRKFEYMRKAYYGSDGIWSDGYFVSTVGVNEHVIRKYIEHQGQEDSGQAQLELRP